MSAATENDVSQPALRVSQLDAAELDDELLQILKDQLKNVFKYFKPDLLVRYDPEITALLKLALWKFSLHVAESTLGQDLLALKYRNERAPSGGQWITNRQKILYAVLSICLTWLKDRSVELKGFTGSWPLSDKLWLAVDWLDRVWKLATLLNFMAFLLRGQYRSVLERVLGIRAVFPHPMGVRQVGFEYVERELLWHGFAEFLFFMLPLVNFRRIKNTLSRYYLRQSKTELSSARSPADYKECAICGEWPNLPREIGCQHVFCYYCIQSNFLADSSYTCPSCGMGIEDKNCIQPVQIKLHQAEVNNR